MFPNAMCPKLGRKRTRNYFVKIWPADAKLLGRQVNWYEFPFQENSQRLGQNNTNLGDQLRP